jgi:hypothetical protein
MNTYSDFTIPAFGTTEQLDGSIKFSIQNKSFIMEFIHECVNAGIV